MQKKDKNSEFLYFYFLNMSKKNLTVLFLLLSGVIAVLAYAGGKQSNWLSDNQINFAKDNLSTDRGNKLEAQLRDAVSMDWRPELKIMKKDFKLLLKVQDIQT